MQLYLIYRKDEVGYDEYDSAVVAAESIGEARRTHPGNTHFVQTWNAKRGVWVYQDGALEALAPDGSWVSPSKVSVTYIGEAKKGTKPGVICASFNAG